MSFVCSAKKPFQFEIGFDRIKNSTNYAEIINMDPQQLYDFVIYKNNFQWVFKFLYLKLKVIFYLCEYCSFWNIFMYIQIFMLSQIHFHE